MKTSRHVITCVITLGVAALVQQASAAMVDLGTAADFAVLAGSGITIKPPNAGVTTITGDIGSFGSSSAITGTGNLVLSGVNQAGDGVTQGAKNDLTTAYNAAAGLTPAGSPLVSELGGQHLGAGVYTFVPGTVTMNGTLTLDAHGVAGALFVFQVPSDLSTFSGGSFNLIGGADACNIIWQVSSTAALLASTFDGTILALTSITVGDGVTVDGRLLAQTGDVTLIHDTITTDGCAPGSGTGGLPGVPDSGSTVLLLGFGLVSLIGFRTISRQSQLQAGC